MIALTDELLNDLLSKLIRGGREREWVEFKIDYVDDTDIGEYLSAMSNAAKYEREQFGYLVCGVSDDGTIVGTNIRPSQMKVGNQELKMWLSQNFNPPFPVFDIFEFRADSGLLITIFRIPPVLIGPLKFKNEGYTRIGTCKTSLRGKLEYEKRLWEDSPEMSFERGLANTGLKPSDVKGLLELTLFYQLSEEEMPHSDDALFADLERIGIVAGAGDRTWSITNIGALLLAKDVTLFPAVANKTVRLLSYSGVDNLSKTRDVDGRLGYISAFQKLINTIYEMLPVNEIIMDALRQEVKMYPKIVLREFIANAIAHQDLTVSGRPQIEIYSDRIEISNPGRPSISPSLFVAESLSRNEKMVEVLRRTRICEQRGSGIPRALTEIEKTQLPPPSFNNSEHRTNVIVFAHRTLSSMDYDDKIRACYQHCCLLFRMRKRMSNSTFRERMGIEPANSAIASRIIADTREVGLIKVANSSSTSLKFQRYIPYWAEQIDMQPQNNTIFSTSGI